MPRPELTARFLPLFLMLVGAPFLTAGDGNITGQGRFERIKGRPAAGYAGLYESNLFLSPGGPGIAGPARRLGAPPGQAPSYDGFYSIDAPAGGYSILVNQPLFFIRPKVVMDAPVIGGAVTTLQVDLPLDFSTWFTDTWALPYGSEWAQTFVATGTSITGVSWKLAGTNATVVRAEVLADDGGPDPLRWPPASLRAAKTDAVEARSDNWVRWRSGEVPTTPGKRYAVKLTGVEGGDRKFSPFNRKKDALSYPDGRAYDGAGAAQDYDLNVTVFSDNDGTAVIYSKTTTGLGDLRDGYFATRWCQSFRAGTAPAVRGASLAAADVWAAGGDQRWDLDFTWRVLRGGPAGPQVGPSKTTRAAYQAFGAGLHGVSWSPGEVILEPGEVYCLEFQNPEGFNPYVMDAPEDAFPDGAAYQNGALKSGGTVDLSMTIVVYLEGGGSIGGTVRDRASARPLEGCQVLLADLGRSVLTDSGGAYLFRQAPAGAYRLRAVMAGYSSREIPAVEVLEGGQATADFDLERTPCGLTFTNGGFDQGLGGWTRYGSTKSSNPTGAWFGGIQPAEGSRFWGNEVNGAALGSGGAYQRFCAEPGHRYRAAARSNLYWIDGSAAQTRSRIGLHPAGGAAPDALTVWSAWDLQPLAKKQAWREIAVEAPAAGPVVTVFLEFEQRDAATPPPSTQWRINCFDGVAVEDLDAAVRPRFRRGDCRQDGALDLTDAVYLLGALFLGSGEPSCSSACDANDDGGLDLSDAIRVLEHLFLGGGALPPPAPGCGDDPTADPLTCLAPGC